MLKALFQFQTGSIKSDMAVVHADVAVLFQFQTGSIKSQQKKTHKTSEISFNSKLVRLKVTI